MLAPDFLEAVAMVLCVAAVTTVVFQKARAPVVLGYVIAGLLVGPHVPILLIADPSIVQTLSELGVILLMFSLGLEFRLTRLMRTGPAAAVTAVLETALMLWLGFVAGRALGWSTKESVFCGAVVAISSTTIVAKAFQEQGIRGHLRHFVVSILVVEDLIAILLLAGVTALASGHGLSLQDISWIVARLLLFLVGLVVVGLLAVPRLVRFITKLGRSETTLVFSIGFCFALALLAHELGYSVAMGAFIAGSLIAESGEGPAIEHLVQPVRDMFAAIFFVSVGMLLDPQLVLAHWPAIVVLSLVVIVGKVVGVSLGAIATGHDARTSVQSGMSLAQIGEFSFIIASVALSLSPGGSFLYPVAVCVSAVTMLTTPLMLRASVPVSQWADERLPPRLQTVLALYSSWFERLIRQPDRAVPPQSRRLLGLLVLDTMLLCGIAVGSLLGRRPLVAWARERFAIDVSAARLLVAAAALLLALPLLLGMLRLARRLGVVLAQAVLPTVETGTVDLAATPRRVLVLTLQLAIVLVVSAPVLAMVQPFISVGAAAGLWLLLLLVLATQWWRSAADLQGHVRAGAQAIIEALRPVGAAADDQTLTRLRKQMPGLGEPTAIPLGPGSPAVGKTLGELNLRFMTGATVLAIARGRASIVLPMGDETLLEGDVLAIAGTHSSIVAARALLEPAVAGGGLARPGGGDH